MSEPKTYASLSSGLLARKGGAKPAMRPQGFTNFGANIEDLGWNDMGGQQAEPFDHVPSSISALTPAPSGRASSEPSEPSEPELDTAFMSESVPEPVVVEQQRALEESFQPAEPEPPEIDDLPQITEAFEIPEVPQAALPQAPARRGDVVRLPKRQAVPAPVASQSKAKAAFTLRLDPERHLRLRLACALTRKSAQQLVTHALDDFLSTLPEVEELAGHVPAGQRSR